MSVLTMLRRIFRRERPPVNLSRGWPPIPEPLPPMPPPPEPLPLTDEQLAAMRERWRRHYMDPYAHLRGDR